MSQITQSASHDSEPAGRRRLTGRSAIARESRLDSGLVKHAPFRITSADGAHLIAEDGRRYLDAGTSHGMNHVGHNHPTVVKALHEQLAQAGHVPLAFANDTRLELLERLVGNLAPAANRFDRAWLCATGTEANEAAIKFARQATGRSTILSLRRGFHGRTMGALSATHKKPFQEPFAPLVPGFEAVTPNDVEALKTAITDDTAALLMEPVQGEGGVHPLEQEFVRTARDLTRDHGALLVFDEVQTGLGRTGSFYGFEPFGVEPDMVTLGKGLGGGLPLAATLATEEVMGAQKPKTHGSTFSGNPITAAAGAAVLDVIRKDALVERAAAQGDLYEQILGPLREHAAVNEVRVRGAMVGIDLKTRAAGVMKALTDRNVLAITAGPTVVRLLPPLILDDAEARGLADAVVAAVDEGAAMARRPARATSGATERGGA